MTKVIKYKQKEVYQMTVTLCNNNPNSPNAVRLGNGIFGGRISSRDRYNVCDSEPPFPFDYQRWSVRDLQDDKWYSVVKHGNVETRSCTCMDYNENYKKYGDGTWASFGFAKYACEHIRAVALYLDECRKDARKREKSAPQTISEHTQHLIDGWGHLVKPHSTGAAKKEFWDGVRIYANRRDINPDELTKSVLKELFPAPQKTGGVKSTDFWTDDVKEKVAAQESKKRKAKSTGKQATPHQCASCGARILPGKKRCSPCVDRMLSRKGWDPDQPDLPTTNAVIRNPLEKPTPPTIIEKEDERASPFIPPPGKVHIQSIDSLSHWGVCADDGNGDAGEIIKNGFKNPVAAKQWTKRKYPQAQIIVWRSI